MFKGSHCDVKTCIMTCPYYILFAISAVSSNLSDHRIMVCVCVCKEDPWPSDLHINGCERARPCSLLVMSQTTPLSYLLSIKQPKIKQWHSIHINNDKPEPITSGYPLIWRFSIRWETNLALKKKNLFEITLLIIQFGALFMLASLMPSRMVVDSCTVV